MTLPSHSSHIRSTECPVLACPRGRDVRIQIDFPSGQRRVVTGCEKHVALLASRAVMRVVKLRGGDAGLKAHVDGVGYTDTYRATEWYGERRCIA